MNNEHEIRTFNESKTHEIISMKCWDGRFYFIKEVKTSVVYSDTKSDKFSDCLKILERIKWRADSLDF